MDFLKRRLSDDPWNVQLRYYSLIEEILNEKWLDVLQLLEETPFDHSHLIEFALKVTKKLIFEQNGFPSELKFLPSTMIEQIQTFQERLQSFQIYRTERRNLSSSSSSTSTQSLDQSILFLSQAKLYRKSSHWKQMGRGECEIIENHQTGEIVIRFWSWKRNWIQLLLLVNLHEKENLSVLSENISTRNNILFQSTNQCDYPSSNSSHLYQLQFDSEMDVIRFRQVLFSLEQ